MDEYTKLINKVNTYLQLEDIEMSKDYISAYDLLAILNETLEPLREVASGENFKRKINSDYAAEATKRKIFSKKAKVENECKWVHGATKGEVAQIAFCFEKLKKTSGPETMVLYRDFGTEEVYFGSYYQDRDFAVKYYKEITSYFDILEKFAKYYLGTNINTFEKVLRVETLVDSFLKVDLNYDNRGNASINISISKDYDPNNIYRREWVNQKSIETIIKEKQEEILKKIPLKTSDLSITCQNFIKPYRKGKKVLQKTNK